MNEPKISVVMPAYNEESTLKQIVERVLAQELVDELIIVNDCSSDKTGPTCRPDRSPIHHPYSSSRRPARFSRTP